MYLPRDLSNLTQLRTSLFALWYTNWIGFKTENMGKDKVYLLHVHLITVEVGIVRRCYRKI
jgi:hypothetical protein